MRGTTCPPSCFEGQLDKDKLPLIKSFWTSTTISARLVIFDAIKMGQKFRDSFLQSNSQQYQAVFVFSVKCLTFYCFVHDISVEIVNILPGGGV